MIIPNNPMIQIILITSVILNTPILQNLTNSCSLAFTSIVNPIS